ncbi:MAG: hypothetical protein CMD26_02785 [Flavobacteriales bacterium]|nr:hypothetical protein [Flavobacteriales bacterium]|tara:strand:- start:4322 stop:6304 length:1983 start_codon:yes stop_codon:yes gene_type:complete
MMSIKYPLRLTFITIALLFISVGIIASILKIINSKEYAEVDHLKIEKVQANRGSIYSYDNQLLAFTSSRYDVRIDEVYALSIASDQEIQDLANDLSEIFELQTADQYLNEFYNNTHSRYLLLKRNASFHDMEKLKKSFFYKKPLKGGIVVEEYLNREKPNLNLAARTIGDLYKDNSIPKYGLEYSYNSDLMGKDGQQLTLYEPGVGKRKINNSNNIESIPGKDLITTIDLNAQDIVEEALLRQLEKYEADFGTVVLMEVRTGQIKSIVNLKKTPGYKYAEILNYAATRLIEPGSTMKLASLMAYFEDFGGSVNDTVDCKNGKYRFKGAPIDTYDSKKLGFASLNEVFAHSSNIGVGRLIQKYYNSNPDKFINRLYSFGLGEKSKIDLIGVPNPKMISPADNSWSLIALPWMSFGYGVNFTPLDILTFYNTVANNGYLVQPHLGHSLRSGSELSLIPRNTVNHTICSQSTIDKIKILLQNVITTGTARSLNSLSFSISGKTGTTVKNYTTLSSSKQKEYQSSFVGFFPSENPQYSCIVLIDNPRVDVGYYGSEVAVPVFAEIAQKLYVKKGLKWNNNSYHVHNLESTTNHIINSHNENFDTLLLSETHYPNVVGMHIRDALYLLEMEGYKVIVKGKLGNVKRQYPRANTPITNNLAITLFI